MSIFDFLQPEWPSIYEAANKAADAVNSDPRTACFYARRALEMSVAWMYRNERSLSYPTKIT